MTYVPIKYFNSGIAITNPRFRHRWSWPLSCFPDQLASWICIASLYIDGFVDSSRWNYSRSPVRSVNKFKQKSCLLVVIACILYIFSRCITSLESVDALCLVSTQLRECLGLFAGSLHGYKIERSFLKLDDLHSGAIRSCSTRINLFCLGPLSDTDPQSIIGFRMSGLTECLEPMEVTEQPMIIADGWKLNTISILPLAWCLE